MKDHMDADTHLQTVKETHTRAVGCPKEAVTTWEACVGAGPSRDLQTQGERSPPLGTVSW